MVLKENLQSQQTHKELLAQMRRQKDQLQQVITINERNLIEANSLVSQAISDEAKQKAAQFLVQQIRALQDERQ